MPPNSVKIDSHIHALPERSIALLRRDPVYRVTFDGMKWHGGNYPDFEITPKWFDPDTALAGMRKNGIDMGIMSAAPKPLFYYEVDLAPAVTMCRETNLGLAEFQKAHPNNFRWMAHLPLRFYLDVGACERPHNAAVDPDMVASNRAMRDVLRAKGYDHHYTEFAGGHDYSCWRGTLADGLIALLGRSTPSSHRR